MDRLPNAATIEVRRALPVNAVEQTQPTPTPAPPPVVPAVVDDAANIRIAPPGAGAPGALDNANSLYTRKLYSLAIPEYGVFLASGQGTPGRDAALFRVAECHRMAGNRGAARIGYEKLLTEFPSGEFAAAGAYRLGEFLFSEKIYDPAAIQFDLASREAKEAEVRLAATYFAARSFEALKKSAAAEDRYRTLLAVETNNPYRENAAAGLATVQLAAGKKKAALETYELIASISTNADVTANATLQAALLAKELGLTSKALALFDQAAASADSAIKSEALLGALRLRYNAGDFQGITQKGEETAQAIPSTARAEALPLLAAAYRQIGNEPKAREIYDRLLRDYPAAATSDTLYQRLLSLYAVKDKTLVAEADAFLKTATDPKQVAGASLLKAETLYQQQDYAAAARAYAPLVENNSLKKEQRSAALYKLAWCLAASGDQAGAIRSYTAFANKYPDDKLAATALLQRGLAHQKAQAYAEAVADFDEVITRYQFSKEVELALLQKALTLGQQKKYSDMAAAFESLLKRYPNSPATAQANFWLGWAAYENKDYKAAVAFLDQARRLDPKTYGDRAALRILLSHYQRQDRNAASLEADKYTGGVLPAEVVTWLSQGYLEEKNYAKAEKLLRPLAENPATTPVEAWLLLADARLGLDKFEEAAQAADKAISTTEHPATKARGFIAKARAAVALNRPDTARQAVDQALFLQPEGRINAEARLASGEIYFSTADYDSAARAFMSVSVLTDDPEVTPRALSRAVEAYRRAQRPEEADKALKELSERFPNAQPPLSS
jgi:TolA-binding protein